LKFTLISPQVVRPAALLSEIVAVPPLGVGYLAGTLRAAHHEVEVIDAYGLAIDRSWLVEDGICADGLTVEEVADRVPRDTDVIAISCMFSSTWIVVNRIADLLRERFPTTPMIMGGEHVTAETERVLTRHPDLLCCALGEGEETVLDIAEVVAGRKDLSAVAGVAFLDRNGSVVSTDPRDPIRDIDRIPWPSWDGVPVMNYVDQKKRQVWREMRSFPLVATRGCPYKCAFCTNALMWKQHYRMRDPKDVVKEAAHYATTYRLDHIEFHDLTLIVNRKWVQALCREIMEADLGITWSMPIGARSEALDAETFKLIKASGCDLIGFAPDSGSPTTLKRIRKQVDLRKMAQSMAEGVREGLHVRFSLIIDLPGETKREIWESMKFAMKAAWIGVHDIAVFRYSAYPGSELYRGLVESGRIDPDAAEFERTMALNAANNFMEGRCWSEHLKPWQVPFFLLSTIACFYGVQFIRRPARALKSLFRILTGNPGSQFDRHVVELLRRVSGARRATTGTVSQ